MRLLLPFLLFALFSCSSDAPEPTPPPPNAPPAGTAETFAAEPDTSDSVWTTDVTEVERSRPYALLQAVRSATHDGFDRAVFEFDGDHVPGYHVAYLDEPARQCGSGHAVELPGDGRLEVRFPRTHAHTDDGTSTLAERSLSPDLPVLRELTLTCDFEGIVTWVLGLATPPPYRITELSDPARLVVDVRH